MNKWSEKLKRGYVMQSWQQSKCRSTIVHFLSSQSYGAGQRVSELMGVGDFTCGKCNVSDLVKYNWFSKLNLFVFCHSISYERVDEIIWVKTNQLQRIIRTGRTGHWLNHGKEHCLVCVRIYTSVRMFEVDKMQTLMQSLMLSPVLITVENSFLIFVKTVVHFFSGFFNK